MSRRKATRLMLINAAEKEECRVAVVEDGRLELLDRSVTGSEQYKGNIYKGVVVRVEPSLQAAFVEYGGNRAGFLPMAGLNPMFYDGASGPEAKAAKQEGRRPRIENVLRKGQELLVQVEREEMGKKGAALTTWLSIAGRYLVLMPYNSQVGVSRKITEEEERERMKRLAQQLDVPDGMGLIVRTAGVGRTKQELNRDLAELLKIWESIEKEAESVEAPSLLYKERDVIVRVLRDNFSTDVKEVLCDTAEAYEEAKRYFKTVMPRYAGRVKLYEGKEPIFNRFGIEEQIESMYHERVALPSGGSIVIEQTEAMVCIDVNSARATQEKGVEQTAYKTNLEAAREIARQIRLRDLAGLIVIDFIDMKDSRHVKDVEKTFKTAMKQDRAKYDIGRMSRFMILEMARQRLKNSYYREGCRSCPLCGGIGRIRTPEDEGLHLLRELKSRIPASRSGEFIVETPIEVATFLLNRKKDELVRLEKEYGVSVTIKPLSDIDVRKLNMENEESFRYLLRGRIREQGARRPRPEQAPAGGGEDSASRAEDARESAVRAAADDSACGAGVSPGVVPIDGVGEGTPIPEEHRAFGCEPPDRLAYSVDGGTPCPPGMEQEAADSSQASDHPEADSGSRGAQSSSRDSSQRQSSQAGSRRRQRRTRPQQRAQRGGRSSRNGSSAGSGQQSQVSQREGRDASVSSHGAQESSSKSEEVGQPVVPILELPPLYPWSEPVEAQQDDAEEAGTSAAPAAGTRKRRRTAGTSRKRAASKKSAENEASSAGDETAPESADGKDGDEAETAQGRLVISPVSS